MIWKALQWLQSLKFPNPFRRDAAPQLADYSPFACYTNQIGIVSPGTKVMITGLTDRGVQ